MKKLWMGIGIAVVACVAVYGVASAMMGSNVTASAEKTMVITSSGETPECCASKAEATTAHAALTAAEGECPMAKENCDKASAECPMAKSVASAECQEAKGCSLSQTAAAGQCSQAGKSEGQTAMVEK